tara:strand:- start:614 stop:919 length:306 start_codon:yes stop_codon:yes gene_type:complete
VKETLIKAIRNMFENKWEYLELGSSQTDLVESYVIQTIRETLTPEEELKEYHRKALDVAFQLMDDEQVGRWNYFMELPDNEFADWDIVAWEENYEDKMEEE